ncbi:hypothetical protein [Corynebacterium sputi]|uniref:hypothetical protein n=1 Tax=Corynebacterium sputi TaxID=489915 RepID=UPI0012EB851B|nr:hypothetical protein [Corynebacterium sputi]
MTTILTAAALVTGHEVLRPGWLEITGDTVTALGQGPAPRPLTNSDRSFAELTIVPGFVDMHIHGGGGSDFSHARHGTTSMAASLVSAHPEELLRQVDVLSGHARDGLLAGIHLEGPWLAPSKKGAHDPAALRRPDSVELDRVLSAARGTVRMVTLAPELPGAMDAIRRTVDEGAVAAVGHTDAMSSPGFCRGSFRCRSGSLGLKYFPFLMDFPRWSVIQ